MIRLADIQAEAANGPLVLVLVAGAEGSTPRGRGTPMLVSAESAQGTIGGGAAEHRAIEIAREMLTNEDATAEIFLPLGPALDQCCGGQMRLVFARFDAGTVPDDDGILTLWPGGPQYLEPEPARPVLVYGAGHVGRALVRALVPLPFAITWVDARRGQMKDAWDDVECVETPLPEAVAETADSEAFHIVLTHSHALDLEIVAAILVRPFGFCGLIGSATKRAVFARRLAERGVAQSAIARLTCPIGLKNLRDKRPEVIAASVAAQLLQVDAARAALPQTQAG